MRAALRQPGWAAFLVTFAVAAAFLVASQPQPAPAAAQVGPPTEEDEGLLAEGRQLYLTGCSSCHGPDGRGTEQGPSLLRSGEAGAYYYLSTGRMPLNDVGDQPRRKRPAYTPAEIDLLVTYVGSLGSGPEIPRVRPGEGDLAEGGELYRSNCAPCHTASAIGGALSYGRAAPALRPSEPLQIASAVRVGPGQMPVFDEQAIGEEELDDLVRYVRHLDDPEDRGGVSLGNAGPIPEGAVAWVFGMGALLLAVYWIGTRQQKDPE